MNKNGSVSARRRRCSFYVLAPAQDVCYTVKQERKGAVLLTKDELRAKANDLPLLPGVYLMMDKTGKVIYVGKAKKLKNRVSQYFQESASHTLKTRQMVSQVDHFDTIFVSSEFEALVLENSLIKRHMPRYNILLKDDKGYPFVRLSRGRYPKFTLVNRPANDGARYFGPFGGRYETRQALDAVCQALRLPTCRRQFPRDIGAERPCLNFHMGRCDGFCRPDMPEAEYDRRMEQACQLLEGRSKQLLRDMTAEMEVEAEALRFEQAAQLRDRIQAIGALGKKQTVIAGLCADTDVWGVFRGAGKSGYAVLHMENGNLVGRETELLTSPMEETAAELLAAITAQYYLPRAILPHEILLCVDTGDCEELSEALTQRAGRKVWVHVPQRGEKSTLADMAIRNAQEEVQRATTVEEKTAYTLEALQKMLHLAQPPKRMESFDISNTGSSDIVASMVVYQGTKPLKSAYRRFQIKELTSGHPDPRRRRAGGGRAVRLHRADLRYGEGRPPPHPRSGHARGPGDRHCEQSGGVLPHRADSGGDPPLCHHLSPPASHQKRHTLCIGRHPRSGAEAAGGAAKDIRHHQGHPGSR